MPTSVVRRGAVGEIGEIVRKAPCRLCVLPIDGLPGVKEVQTAVGTPCGIFTGEEESFDCIMRACGGDPIAGRSPKRVAVSTRSENIGRIYRYDAWDD